MIEKNTYSHEHTKSTNGVDVSLVGLRLVLLNQLVFRVSLTPHHGAASHSHLCTHTKQQNSVNTFPQQLDGKLMGHVVPGFLLFGLSMLWYIELFRRRVSTQQARSLASKQNTAPWTNSANPSLHMPRASFTTLECLGKLLLPVIGIATEIRSAARYHLPHGFLPAFEDHPGELRCQSEGDHECRRFTSTLQHWFHITIHLGFMCAAFIEIIDSRRGHRPFAALGTHASLIGERRAEEHDIEEASVCDPEGPGASLDSLNLEVGSGSFDTSDEDDRVLEDEGTAGGSAAALLSLSGAVLQMSFLFAFHSSMHKDVKGDAIEARAHELLCVPLNVCALALFCEALLSLLSEWTALVRNPGAFGRWASIRLYNTFAGWLLFFRAYGMCVAGIWLMHIPLHGRFSALLFDRKPSAVVMFLDMEMFWFFMTVAVISALVSYTYESLSVFARTSGGGDRRRAAGINNNTRRRMRLGRRAARKLKLDRDKIY